MRNCVTLRNLKAKDLGLALRRGLHLAPDERAEVKVSKVTTLKRKADGKPVKHPWREIRGSLSPAEADEMLRVIKEQRRNKSGSGYVQA